MNRVSQPIHDVNNGVNEATLLAYLIPTLPYLGGFALLVCTTHFQWISSMNAAAQLILFIFLDSIPAWKTHRMSYVDIAWPWGIVAIGAVTWLFSDGHPVRVAVVSLAYLIAGGRMGL